MDLAAKLIPIGETSKENHTKQTHCRYKISPLYKQKPTTLRSCRKQFSKFKDFKAFNVLLTGDILDVASERVAMGRLKVRITSSSGVADMKQCK